MAATKAQDWKTSVEITLPSGYVVEIRPLGYDLILKCDHVPDVITSLVVKAFKGENVAPEINEFAQAREYVEFLDTCCELCFVHPQIVAAPEGEDQISAAMVEWEDKAFVFGLLGKSRRWLELFRAEQIADVPAGAEKPALPDAAEPTAAPEAALAG